MRGGNEILFWHNSATASGQDAFHGGVISSRSQRTEPDDPREIWGCSLELPLLSRELAARLTPGAARLLVRARVAPHEQANSPADGEGAESAERAFAAWSPRTRADLDDACDRLAPVASGANVTICVRPHAHDAISDIPSCLTFLRRRADGPFAIVLNPFDLITAGMMARAEDHLARIADALFTARGVAAVLVPGRASLPNLGGSPDLVAWVARRAVVDGIPLIVPAEEAREWQDTLAPR